MHAGAEEPQQNCDLSTSEVLRNASAAQDCNASGFAHPGLGSAAMPDFDYPEDSHAGLGTKAAARPLYDRSAFWLAY